MADEVPTTKILSLRVPIHILKIVDAYAASTRRSRNSAILYLMEVGISYEGMPAPKSNDSQRTDRE